jgi:molybdopterin-guanine dinucleotide biosynthesis protein A
MGRDKSLLVYHDRPQREYLFHLLSHYCNEVFTSTGKDQNVPAQLNPLPDRFEISGPMNGILSAFAFKPYASWLILAVDMPSVNPATVELLLRHRDQTKMATCFYNPVTEQPEPLLTLWENDAYPALLKFLEKGNVSPREFLKTHSVNMVSPPDDKTLLNFNTPDDLLR